LLLVHSFPIVHGDITSSNILIDIKKGQYKACLTDFGLSTVLGGLLDDHTVQGSTVRYGAIRWTAPELLQLVHDHPADSNVKPTKQNDIYSFGRVMFHVLTLLIPWNGIDDYQVLHKIHCGEEIRRPETPHVITDARWNEIELCWSIDALARPSALMVMDFLKNELEGLTDSDGVSSRLLSSRRG
ncbi:kinase-like protein, partial [Rhizopogon vinicolor AM-OR11-026]